MKFKPLSPGLVEQCWGVRGWATWSSSHRSGSQPGRWEELFLFHHCRGVENWLADLEIQFVELEEEMSTTGPSIWWDSESSSPSWCCFPYSTQCHLQLAKSLGFLWVWTETSRDWKERLKLHREFTSKTRHVHSFPTWPLSLSLTNGPGPREGHHSREKAWLENGPESRMTIMEQLLGLPESSWTGALASEKSEFGSLLFLFLSWPRAFQVLFHLILTVT